MDITDTHFIRSAEQFFHQHATRQALCDLASSDSLIIYCGAGVTIDRTGMGWGELIANIFRPDGSAHRDYPSPEEISLLANREDPIRLASVLTRYGLDRDKTEGVLKDRLTPLLQHSLYRSNSWQSGMLARSVCRLAIVAAIAGKRVEIITTNYDIYLEQAFDIELRRMEAESEAEGFSSVSELLPRLEVFVRDEGAEDERLVDRGHSGRSEPTVRLHYIHGRVPESGTADGHLVISEDDYARSRTATITTLRKSFSTGCPLLILGASLTDPPLVDALILSRPTGAPEDYTRFVLMSRQSLGYLNQATPVHNRLVGHLARRCELLGTKLLAPDFRFQAAQFCVELEWCIATPGGADVFLSDLAGTRYGLRFSSWWDHWSKTDIARNPLRSYARVAREARQTAEFIAASSPARYGAAASHERFRLEFWVRDNPKGARRLTLWASSSGPLMDAETRRNAELRADSSNASVKAFLEGRPQYFDAASLGDLGSGAGKWRSYLAVPVYDEAPVGPSGGRIPVGIMTLASTSSAAQSMLPLPKNAYMEELIDRMIHAGRLMLRAPAPGP